MTTNKTYQQDFVAKKEEAMGIFEQFNFLPVNGRVPYIAQKKVSARKYHLAIRFYSESAMVGDVDSQGYMIIWEI